MKKSFFITGIWLIALVGSSQQSDYFSGRPEYPFIRYTADSIAFPGDNFIYEPVYPKFDSIILYGTGKLTILHIGGSHIQADIYTHIIRKQLQSLQLGMNGGRGILFPYQMAKTNNPSNYRITVSGNWEFCKNTQHNRNCSLGLTGYAISTTDSVFTLKIDPNKDTEIRYSFSRVKILHSPAPYLISAIVSGNTYTSEYDSIGGFSLLQIPESEYLVIEFRKILPSENKLSIYGIIPESADPGIVYHAVGVNGARLSSYLKAELYSQHLSILNPDLIIFSIGTNDGNTREFKAEEYYEEYVSLIEISKLAAPDAKILITVPNDCYLYKRYVNKNTALMRDIIYRIASEYNYGVWDFYSIMGGYNSSQEWYSRGLMQSDRIHFSKEGYRIKGNLLTTAILSDWEKNLRLRNQDQCCPQTNTLDTLQTQVNK